MTTSDRVAEASVRIAVDAELCAGHGRCAASAPEVYVLDAEGYNRDRGHVMEVPAEVAEAARRGLRVCPEGALTLQKSGATPR